MTQPNCLAMLAPRVLGQQWVGYEGASSFGVFWRASRLNNLHRSELRTFLHVALRKGDDVFLRTTRSAKVHEGLRFTFSFAEFLKEDHWQVEEWWPFGGPVPFDSMPWRLIVCPACARSCYHSLLFQMPGVRRCPWHGIGLIDACPKCQLPILSGFHDDFPLGRCRCGHDLVNYVATAEGDTSTSVAKKAAISFYLARAAEIRIRTWLIAPEGGDANAWKGLHRLGGDRTPNKADLVDHIVLAQRANGHEGRLGPRSGLETFNPGIAALPFEWTSAFKKIGKNIFEMLPKSDLLRLGKTSGEVRRAFGYLATYPGGGYVYLDTETLDRAVLRCASHLANALLIPGGRRAPTDSGLGRWVSNDPDGIRLVHAVLRRVLLRGYADGARVAMGRHLPSMYDDKRMRPVRRLPWVLLNMPRSESASAEIAWTRQRGTF